MKLLGYKAPVKGNEVEENGETSTLKKGFTLIELMVVVVIIGILAALAIPKFLGATDKAKFAEKDQYMKSIATVAHTIQQSEDTIPSIADTGERADTEFFTYSIDPTDGYVKATLKVNLNELGSIGDYWEYDFRTETFGDVNTDLP